MGTERSHGTRLLSSWPVFPPWAASSREEPRGGGEVWCTEVEEPVKVGAPTA